MDLTQNTEELRQSLLEEIYAGAASGLGAMLLDEEKIRQARPGRAGGPCTPAWDQMRMKPEGS